MSTCSSKRNTFILTIKKKKYLYNSLYSFEKNGIFNKIFLILKLRKQ